MMGSKKARTVRRQLETALARTGQDPIQWLEDRIRQLEKEGNPVPHESEVPQALCRVVQGSKKSKPQPTRVRTRTSR